MTVPEAPGEEVTLNFDYGGVSIEGVVSDPEGQPVHFATVDVFPQRSAVISDPNWAIPRSWGWRRAPTSCGRGSGTSGPSFVDVELRDFSDRQTVQLQLR